MGSKIFWRLMVSGALTLGLVACEDEAPAEDTGAALPDASQTQPDASVPPEDNSEPDGGGSTATPADASQTPPNTAVAPLDAGQEVEDAGPVVDATVPDASGEPVVDLSCDEDPSLCDAEGLVCDAETKTCVACTEADASACPAETPYCDVETNTCVACSVDDPASCAAGEYCDAASQQCKSLAPWRPDCSAPPTDSVCMGGPREVLLVTDNRGLIAMFDPDDGEFLGNLKRETRPFADEDNEYSLATQGPDMCIWTTREGDSADAVAIERWDTDGTRIDEVIPFGEHLVDAANGQDVVDEPLGIGFTESHVYVASDGYPNPRLSRFTLDGDFVDVVLDDGARATSVQVLADGRLVLASPECSVSVSTSTSSCVIVSNVYGGAFVVDPETGERSTLWNDVEPRQVWYAGEGQVLTHDHSLGGELASVNVSTGERSVIRSPVNLEHSKGIAALGDGRWLVTSTDESVVAINPSAPAEPAESLWNDVSVRGTRGFQQVGRACVPEAVIEAARSRVGSACAAMPEGDPLLVRDFEADEGDVYVDGGAAGTQKSLVMAGNTGARINLPAPAEPSYVGFYLRTSGFSFSAETSTLAGMVNTDDYYVESATLWDDSLQTFMSRAKQPMQADTWYKVEFTQIDWEAQQLDVCVDGIVIAADVAFERADLPVDRISFGNRDADVTSWLDELVVK